VALGRTPEPSKRFHSIKLPISELRSIANGTDRTRPAAARSTLGEIARIDSMRRTASTECYTLEPIRTWLSSSRSKSPDSIRSLRNRSSKNDLFHGYEFMVQRGL